ncbi:MAG: type I secretion system permease/ATPase [Alphaproteobacteria bacterium]|nr:type I secretion system permease/ATPase [Alphaproteobacteria bacterium]
MQKQEPVSVHNLMKACYTAFFACGVFSFFVNLLMLTMPLFMFQVFDRVLASRSETTLFLLLMIAASALFVQSALDSVRSFAFVRISRWIDRRIAPLLLSAAVAEALDRSKTANSNALRQLAVLRNFLTGPAMLTILDIPWVPIFLLLILYLNAPMGFAALGGALIMLALGLANDHLTRPALNEAQAYSNRAYAAADAAVRNASVVESMGMRQSVIRRFLTENEAVLALQSRASDRAAMFLAASKSTRMLIQMLIMTVAAVQIIDPHTPMTGGMMIASVLILGRALQPIEQGVAQARGMVEALGAFRQIEETLLNAQAQPERMRLPDPEGRLSAENLFYQPQGLAKPILQRIQFEIEAGETLGVVGPSAAGKSTLARLLVGVERPTVGTVRLDGADIYSWDNEALGQHVGYMPQDVELFSGTVAQNIGRLQDNPDPDEVVRAAKLAGLHELILRLPDGYDTEIGWGGQLLSGGQRQRVALARALYGRPRVVVLDEPNANLDSQGDDALVQAIKALKEAKVTVILITHRPSTLSLMDKIMVLNGGTVQRFGPRDETLSFLQQGRRPSVEGPQQGSAQIADQRDFKSRGGTIEPPHERGTERSEDRALSRGVIDADAGPLAEGAGSDQLGETPRAVSQQAEAMPDIPEPPTPEDAEPDAPKGPRGRGAVVRPPGPIKARATSLQVQSVRAISAEPDKD